MHPIHVLSRVRPSRTPQGSLARPPVPTAGFTILEVAIAAAVLALAISTSITAMQQAFNTLDRARKVTLAGQVMQSEFEKMRLKDWATVNSYPATADITAAIDPSFIAEGAAIVRTFTLTRTVSEVHAEMRQITLTTTWTTHEGRTVSRFYTTFYGKEGLYDYFYNSY